ncbi:hypothetical protein BDB00DRAFT_784567 [Zychaea mexicana]|uniref:uncharacterized protein n=1 Tax=Zychaea mexicana TaxID=64656 RepID=UPI0022FEBCBC|nr:uncharacterized protein BDB00DRAFT_784567 [Zychaea mexicana]KAI9497639.1 hypothetical protein BDB00DRAFT_784567 [Zychaea mexicana]
MSKNFNVYIPLTYIWWCHIFDAMHKSTGMRYIIKHLVIVATDEMIKTTISIMCDCYVDWEHEWLYSVFFFAQLLQLFLFGTYTAEHMFRQQSYKCPNLITR